jgi:hypothetical protein
VGSIPPILGILHLLDSNCPKSWWRFPRSTELPQIILLIDYLHGINSKRGSVKELRMHLTWHWGSPDSGFNQEIPKNQNGRFRNRGCSFGGWQFRGGGYCNASQIPHRGQLVPAPGPIVPMFLAAVILKEVREWKPVRHKTGTRCYRCMGGHREWHFLMMTPRSSTVTVQSN